jgi:hypothetical protein
VAALLQCERDRARHAHASLRDGDARSHGLCADIDHARALGAI